MSRLADVKEWHEPGSEFPVDSELVLGHWEFGGVVPYQMICWREAEKWFHHDADMLPVQDESPDFIKFLELPEGADNAEM